MAINATHSITFVYGTKIIVCADQTSGSAEASDIA